MRQILIPPPAGKPTSKFAGVFLVERSLTRVAVTNSFEGKEIFRESMQLSLDAVAQGGSMTLAAIESASLHLSSVTDSHSDTRVNNPLVDPSA